MSWTGLWRAWHQVILATSSWNQNASVRHISSTQGAANLTGTKKVSGLWRSLFLCLPSTRFILRSRPNPACPEIQYIFAQPKKISLSQKQLPKVHTGCSCLLTKCETVLVDVGRETDHYASKEQQQTNKQAAKPYTLSRVLVSCLAPPFLPLPRMPALRPACPARPPSPCSRPTAKPELLAPLGYGRVVGACAVCHICCLS